MFIRIIVIAATFTIFSQIAFARDSVVRKSSDFHVGEVVMVKLDPGASNADEVAKNGEQMLSNIGVITEIWPTCVTVSADRLRPRAGWEACLNPKYLIKTLNSKGGFKPGDMVRRPSPLPRYPDSMTPNDPSISGQIIRMYENGLVETGYIDYLNLREGQISHLGFDLQNIGSLNKNMDVSRLRIGENVRYLRCIADDCSGDIHSGFGVVLSEKSRRVFIRTIYGGEVVDVPRSSVVRERQRW